MNDAEYESVKGRIAALQEKWNHALGVDAWEIEWCYHREGLGDHGQQFYTAANTVAHWPYLRATVCFAMPTLLDESDWKLESIYVHEMCHLLVAEMQERNGEHYQAHVERTCTMLGRAFQRAMERSEERVVQAEPTVKEEV